MDTEIVKIRTKKGRIITLTVLEKTDTHYRGTDKFGEDVILPITDIEVLLPIGAGGDRAEVRNNDY